MTEIERHWDRICLTVLTIAAAVPAAALLIFRETSQAESPGGWMRIVPACMVLGITGAYGIAILRAGAAIMAPQHDDEGARIRWKRRRTGDVLGILWTTAFALFLLVLAVIVVPALQGLEEETGNGNVEERTRQDGHDKPMPEAEDAKRQGNPREHPGVRREHGPKKPRMNPH